MREAVRLSGQAAVRTTRNVSRVRRPHTEEADVDVQRQGGLEYAIIRAFLPDGDMLPDWNLFTPVTSVDSVKDRLP